MMTISIDKKREWVAGEDYPIWMTSEGLSTIRKGYLLENETPKMAYLRVSNAAANKIKKPEMSKIFFEYIWKGWLCPASPVIANMGTNKGLPISCFGVDVEDSINGIGESNIEMMKLTQTGGGVGLNFSRVRGRGEKIGENGNSEGIIPFAKIYDSSILATNQAGVRRGAASLNLDIEHLDIDEFIRMRRPNGDINRQCLNINHCVVVSNKFMENLINNVGDSRKKWSELLKTRMETGQPYIMFKDNANNANPIAYKNNNLSVEFTNICTEIMLHSKPSKYSFVCCLSSLNLAKFDEWENTNLIYNSIYFLEGVLQEFIDKTEITDYNNKKMVEELKYYQNSRNSAIKGRALGLGVLGWHTYLQSQMIPFASFQSRNLTNLIFKKIQNESLQASKDLANEFGEPEWCVGTGLRHTHRTAVAPTTSNSILSGGVSQGIEPIIANAYIQDSAKGKFLRKNPILQNLLNLKNMDKQEIWDSIISEDGSVQHLDFLNEDEKEVFLTFGEINQMEIVKQAAVRQKYIDQAQSLNLKFPPDVDTKWLNLIHIRAWELGLKTLYYCRTNAKIKGDIAIKNMKDGCVSCEG